MKGLSTTILIVVTAVVILVAALVLLTIFGTGIQNVATISQAQSLCLTSAQTSCAFGAWPTTWNAVNVRISGGTPQSCGQVLSDCSQCSDLKDPNRCKLTPTG
jgi:hypothetical protein